MTREEMFAHFAFLHECADKESSDSYANGGRQDGYDAIQQVYSNVIDKEWNNWLGQQKDGE